MKIIFTITCHDKGGFTGKGGHYYSLITIASELLSAGHDCHIILIGRSTSEVILQSGIPFTHVKFNGINLFSTRKAINVFVNDFAPDIIHSFDSSSFIVCDRISSTHIPHVLTKCGGPNPGVGYPTPRNLILFSKENYEYIKKSKKFKYSNAYLIPNRVKGFKVDLQRQKDLMENFGISETDFVVLRIARICHSYEDSILQSINLGKIIEKSLSIKTRVLIIGKIQDLSTFELVNRSIRSSDLIVTDELYTHNAKELLNVANLVVATGRGVMEAAYLGKNVFVPVRKANGNYPIILNSSTFENLFYFNFSPRNELITDENIVIDQIKLALTETSASFSKSVFNEYFDVQRVVDKYEDVYGKSDKKMPLAAQLYYEMRLIITNFRKFYLK